MKTAIRLGIGVLLAFMASALGAQGAGTFVIEPDRAAVSEPIPCPPPNICDTFAHFIVRRVGGSTGAVGVTVSIVGGTATPSPDNGRSGDYYLLSPVTVGWADGDATERDINIFALQDYIPEPNETVILGLSNPTGGATIGTPSTATMIILDTSAQVQTVPALGPPALLLLALATGAVGLLMIRIRG